MSSSPSKIRLAIVGSSGRMGQRITALAHADPAFQLVGGVESGGGSTARFLSDGKAPIVPTLGELLPKTDVAIDFSAPEGMEARIRAAAKLKKGLVIGTTGLSPKTLRTMKQLSRRIPIVFSPNMSVGVNLLFRLVEEAASRLGHYDIEIVEAHHNLKKDAPSGTALRLAEIAAAASRRSSKDFVYGRKGLVGARKKKEIAVLSLRAGDIVGDHTVYFGTGGERLELTHRAHSRDAFASGALTAAKWIYKRRPGLYSMKDVLERKG